jgi:hypothetical protein
MLVSTEREGIEAGVSRRRFMRNAGAATAGIAVAAAGAETFFADMANPATEPGSLSEINPKALSEGKPLKGDLLAGSIVSMGSRNLVVSPPGSSPVTVSLTPNAHVWRERDAPLSAYSVGEEVVLLGERRGNRFIAVSVMDIFRTWVATINSRTGSLLHTGQGTVMITPHTVAQGVAIPDGISCSFKPIPLDELKAGDEISVQGHLNKKGWMQAATIGTRPKGEQDSQGLP